MGHIQKRSKDRWRARYTGPDGRERSRTFKRKIDAQRYLSTVENAMLRGEWIDPERGRVTFGEWAERWFDTTVTLKPKTRLSYASLLRNVIMPTFEEIPLARIQPLDVKEWVALGLNRGLSASRVRQAYHLFGAIMRAAVESGYIIKSPCIGMRLPKLPQREMLFLSAEQVGALADAMVKPYDTLVYVLAYGGLRWGEAIALRRGRCDLLHSTLHVRESLVDVGGRLILGATKTYANRAVSLPPFLRLRLEDHLEQHVAKDVDALVFTSPNGAPLRHQNWSRRHWARATELAGLPRGLRIHDLRHTCASLLVQQGAHVKVVQRHLGHSTASVTLNTYAHLFPDDTQQVVDGLENAFRASQTAHRRPEDIRGVLHVDGRDVKNGP
ncbi:MAG: tyrosine-type recombinase/integrase [Actinomycetota bacterium]